MNVKKLKLYLYKNLKLIDWLLKMKINMVLFNFLIKDSIYSDIILVQYEMNLSVHQKYNLINRN